MASKGRNMFYENKKQETKEIGTCNLPTLCDFRPRNVIHELKDAGLLLTSWSSVGECAASTLRELYALAASHQPLASIVSHQHRLLELSRFRHYDLLSHQQGAVTKLLDASLVHNCTSEEKQQSKNKFGKKHQAGDNGKKYVYFAILL
ncbi:hypothetical protein AAG570_005665 [Ranatra chinensis]|uniref:Uncharacterized protein n=1 Tax=Ranatra chinensis TaxID=642074 RepID=A0ABD0Y0N7_9HEMI